MARSRMLKPEYFTDADLCELTPLHRLLFAGLWCHADRLGRLEDKPRELKVKILPFDECSAEALLADLARSGFIYRYAASGEHYIAIPKFTEHQHPHHREPQSCIPGWPGVEDGSALGSSVPGPGFFRDEPGMLPVPAGGSVGCSPSESESESESESVVEDLRVQAEPEPTGSKNTHLVLTPTPIKRERKPSEQERLAKHLRDQRASVLGPEALPDVAYSGAEINVHLKPLIVAKADWDLVRDGHELYLRDPYSVSQSPPCPMWLFAKNWPKWVDLALKAKRPA